MQFGYDWDIIFGNLSHQCAQIAVGGTADLLGFCSACLTSAIIHVSCRGSKSSAGSQVPDRSLVFDSKRGKREEKEMIDFPDPGGPAARGCQVAKPPIVHV